jgi:hypothetical protein
MRGFWTAEFGSSEGVFGGGVVLFCEDHSLLGGDGGYFYKGTYEMTTVDEFHATVEVFPFIEGYVSVFNTVQQGIVLRLSGKVVDGTHATAHGSPDGMPTMRFGAKLTKRF